MKAGVKIFLGDCFDRPGIAACCTQMGTFAIYLYIAASYTAYVEYLGIYNTYRQYCMAGKAVVQGEAATITEGPTLSPELASIRNWWLYGRLFSFSYQPTSLFNLSSVSRPFLSLFPLQLSWSSFFSVRSEQQSV